MKNKGTCNVIELQVNMIDPSDVRKIRIGNDIRLKLTIDGIDNLTQANIKQARCYLIDTTFGKKEKMACDKHARRFTREVFPEYYIPSPYRMGTCGAPSYHVCPKNVFHYDHFLPDFHDYHWWPGYHGFGLHPDHFDHPHHIHMHPEHPFIAGPDRFPQPWYLAETTVLNEPNTISCMFPAIDQCHCGVYKLVIVLTLFEQGWGKHNLRTYTIDKGPVFELVDDYTGDSGNITIDVDDSGTMDSMISSISTQHTSYTMRQNDALHLNDDDAEGNLYAIYAELKDGTNTSFNGYTWNLNKLIFSSSDDSVVMVDQNGTIYSSSTSGENKQATITVQNADDLSVKAEYTIIVKTFGNNMKIGFDFANNVDEIESSSMQLFEATGNGAYTVVNDEDGKYLWIASPMKISGFTSSGFSIPMEEIGIKNGLTWYRSVSAILSGEMNFVINI